MDRCLDDASDLYLRRLGGCFTGYGYIDATDAEILAAVERAMDAKDLNDEEWEVAWWKA